MTWNRKVYALPGHVGDEERQATADGAAKPIWHAMLPRQVYEVYNSWKFTNYIPRYLTSGAISYQ